MDKVPMSFKTMFRTSGIVYKRNFGRLFLPLLLFQLVLLVPLMFFTMPGTVSVARSVLLALSRTGGSSLSSVVTVLAIVVCVAVFASPLMVSNVVYVIDSDYAGRHVTFRDASKHAKCRYGSMLKAYFAAIVLLALPVAGIIAVILAIAMPGGVPAAALTVWQIVVVVILALAALLLFFGIVFIPYTVAVEGQAGFRAVFSSYRYAFLGNFWSNFTRVLTAAVIVGLAGLLINWLSQLPFQELYELYLVDPMLALQNPLMIFVILFALLAIVVVTFVFPFWYAFTYHTYQNAKYEYEKKAGNR
ncbi:hypothetical protein [Christensenella tenuis]|uniref:DUF7847 domain-containing protein n=1 Tax=Christensenella tenuis TaxID=2763033 RepID=A0ABR7EGJ9_9FIRM|nr:hypothetical protein [Christensenella tenuis]MBC5648298.1 hypothetical protein [Christensenella tenuis]